MSAPNCIEKQYLTSWEHRPLFNSIIAFSAPQLFVEQTCAVVSALLRYAFLFRKEVNAHLLTRILEGHGRDLGKVSDVILLCPTSFLRFRWMDDTSRPLGNMAPTLQCPECARPKPHWKAVRDEKRPDGRLAVVWWCKGCSKEYSKTYFSLDQLEVGDQQLSPWSAVGGGQNWLCYTYPTEFQVMITNAFTPIRSAFPSINLYYPDLLFDL